MARSLATSTVDRFRKALEVEQRRLSDIILEHETAREEARLAESSAERSPDPASAEAGSMAFEYEKEISIERNSADLLRKVEHALFRIERKEYGRCETCGADIPVARLEVLPYATQCVSCASRN